jgi:hypothetical protein
MPPQISRLVDQIEGKARRAVVGGKCPPGWRFYRVAAKVPGCREELEGTLYGCADAKLKRPLA